MKKKKKVKPQKRRLSDAVKVKKSSGNPKVADSSEFGSVTVLKAGTSLASLLLAQDSNGMTGPIY